MFLTMQEASMSGKKFMLFSITKKFPISARVSDAIFKNYRVHRSVIITNAHIPVSHDYFSVKIFLAVKVMHRTYKGYLPKSWSIDNDNREIEEFKFRAGIGHTCYRLPVSTQSRWNEPFHT